ncbi:iron-sulfur cluster repair protein YtfE [Falsiroseomonas oryzae]|uniref:iron-sulfur cluster repair protein YtfE n=1 Tax=Falsiroseomonas oryzae TaxID=2766473 RepID=UPI0022EB672D|nr:iron-sulfur cluster repair protein YtfE [Roseomonas sp. MO-31]
MSATEAAALAGRSLGEIATSLPGATAVFRRHKLDFCCGGQAVLADAAGPDRLPAIAAELAALDRPDAEEPQDDATLVRLILDRYHAVHRAEVPELVRLARRVEAVHRDHPDAPRGLAALLERILYEMEAHMQKEEQGLFPMILAGQRHLAMPISIMRDEHDDHGERLREIEALTQGHVPPAGACNSWRALYAGTRKFADDLMEHIHLENNVLFPRYTA